MGRATGKFRTEHDLLGPLKVPAHAYWGVQTQRAIDNFKISGVPVSHYPEFVRAFGNAEAVFTVDGSDRPPVRCILRQWRDTDLAEDMGQAVEGTTHLLSVAAAQVPNLVSQRDSVTVFVTDRNGARIDDGTHYEIKTHEDDGRAMLRIFLTGDI